MNKKIIIIIAASLAIILIGVAVVFAVQNSNDNASDDQTVKDNPDKESISSETDDSETTEIIFSETDDTELNETEHEDIETEKPSAETTQTEKETKPSDKESAETKVPTENSAETQAPTKDPEETKAPMKDPEETKAPTKDPEETQAPTKDPEETKPADTKPANPDRNEPVAADFTIYDGDGNKVHLSDFAGKPVILNFWASWCVPCKKEMPDFNEKYLEYGDEIQFLMIDFAKDDKIEDAEGYVSEMGFKFPIYFDVDGDATLTYEVIGFPTTVFIDADGYVVERYMGTISEEKLQSGIDKILK